MAEYCAHPRTELRFRYIAGGSKILQLQCIDCGLSVGSAVSQKDKSVDFLASLNGWDEQLQAATRKQWEEGRDKLHAEAQRKSEEWWAWYNAYLKSPAWQQKRLLALERDAYLCQGCRAARATQVHHLTYEHVGDELLFELISLCTPCHELAHKPTSRGGPPKQTP